MQNFDFQSQFSMSKIIWIFPFFFHWTLSIKEDIFWQLQFLNNLFSKMEVFDGIYTSIHKTKKIFIGQVIVLEHKWRQCKMCASVRQKLGHTNILHVQFAETFKKELSILKVSKCPMKPLINLIHFTSPKETKPPKILLNC